MTPPEKVIVDTNVGIAANGATNVSAQCELDCVQTLKSIVQNGHLVVDSGDLIFREYLRHLSLAGQPGTGDVFMKWVNDNRYNESLCSRVTLSPHAQREFEEFPAAGALASFDRSDRKVVAVSRGHAERPPILVARDRDFVQNEAALAVAGVPVRHLCPGDAGRKGNATEAPE